MKETFCKECGIAIDSDLAFCPSCGTSTQKTKPAPVPNPVQQQQLRSKPPMPRKKKLLFGSIAIVVALLISTHFIITYLTDSTKQLTNMYNAVIDENADDFISQLTVPDDVIFNKTSYVKGFNTSNFSSFHGDLVDTVDRVNDSHLMEVIKDKEGIEVFRVKRGKFLYVYPKTIIEPIGQDLLINSDLEDTVVTIAGEDIKLAGKSATVKNILPDTYTVDLKGKNAYFESEGTITVERSIFSESPEIDLLAADYGLEFTEVPEDSIVYIDDVSTEKTIKEMKNVAPLFGNKTVFHAVRNIDEEKTEASDKITAQQDESISIIFPLLAEAQKETKALAKQTKEDEALIRLAAIDYSDFRYSYEHALNYQDFSSVESYLYASGETYNELNKFISDLEDTYYHYNFITNEVINGSVIDGKVHLDVKEVFTFENHLGQTTRYDRNKEYIMIEVSPEDYEVVKINIENTDREKQ